MSKELYQYARGNVRAMQVYQPGKPVKEAQRELGLSSLVKLASNENPRGPAPAVASAIESGIAEVNLYPDANGFYLKNELASRHGIEPSQITLGSGSNDILELVASVFLDQDSSAVFSQYGFLVYGLAVARMGATAIEVPAKNYAHDLSQMAASVQDNTRVIYIANPNNPTGTYASNKELVALLDAVPSSVLVVLDEAYCEYIDLPDFPDGLALARRYPNLLVTRTFSKAYGLAGLRVGYSVSTPEVADLLNRVRMPFNVTSLALDAAMVALGEEAFLEESVALNRAGMQQLSSGLNELGLPYIPSAANFITFDTSSIDCAGSPGDGSAVYQALLQRGVIVRPVANYHMPQHLRVSIGLEHENAAFLAALTAVAGG